MHHAKRSSGDQGYVDLLEKPVSALPDTPEWRARLEKFAPDEPLSPDMTVALLSAKALERIRLDRGVTKLQLSGEINMQPSMLVQFLLHGQITFGQFKKILSYYGDKDAPPMDQLGSLLDAAPNKAMQVITDAATEVTPDEPEMVKVAPDKPNKKVVTSEAVVDASPDVSVEPLKNPPLFQDDPKDTKNTRELQIAKHLGIYADGKGGKAEYMSRIRDYGTWESQNQAARDYRISVRKAKIEPEKDGGPER